MSETEAQVHAQPEPVSPVPQITGNQIVITTLIFLVQMIGIAMSSLLLTAMENPSNEKSIGMAIGLYGPVGAFVVQLILTIIMRKRRLALLLIPLAGLSSPIIFTVIAVVLENARI